MTNWPKPSPVPEGFIAPRQADYDRYKAKMKASQERQIDEAIARADECKRQWREKNKAEIVEFPRD